MIAHELGHHLLSHNLGRTFKSAYWYYIHRQYLKLPSDKEIYDPVTVEFKKKTLLHKYSCYYR